MKKETTNTTEEITSKPKTMTKKQLMEAINELPDDAEILCRDDYGAIANILSFSKTYLITGQYRYTIDVSMLNYLQQNRCQVQPAQRTYR